MLGRRISRYQFTEQDFAFVAKTLSQNHHPISITDLLKDEEILYLSLDNDLIHQEVVDHIGFLPISTPFYFYITTRKALLSIQIQNRAVADYIANILATYSNQSLLEKDLAQQGLPSQLATSHPYLSDFLSLIPSATPEHAFFIRAHIANFTLFYTSIFAEHIQTQAQHHASPDISFYEHIGRSNFHFTSQDRIAQQKSIDDVLREIAQYFHEIRLSIQAMAENVLHFTPPPTLPGNS